MYPGFPYLGHGPGYPVRIHGRGCYVRVSTAHQNLDRQLESTTTYAQDNLNADLGGVETYRDKSTGTNTEQSGYRTLMANVDDGAIDIVHCTGETHVEQDSPLAVHDIYGDGGRRRSRTVDRPPNSCTPVDCLVVTHRTLNNQRDVYTSKVLGELFMIPFLTDTT